LSVNWMQPLYVYVYSGAPAPDSFGPPEYDAVRWRRLVGVMEFALYLLMIPVPGHMTPNMGYKFHPSGFKMKLLLRNCGRLTVDAPVVAFRQLEGTITAHGNRRFSDFPDDTRVPKMGNRIRANKACSMAAAAYITDILRRYGGAGMRFLPPLFSTFQRLDFK